MFAIPLRMIPESAATPAIPISILFLSLRRLRADLECKHALLEVLFQFVRRKLLRLLLVALLKQR
jgi:hypothetical protein